MQLTSLTVMVPVYNEEYLVEESLNRLFVLGDSPYLEKIQVVVVDDCSIDKTPEILSRLSEDFSGRHPKFEWLFLRHETNGGKGQAIQTAIRNAACDISIIHDADLEYYPKDILRMIPLFVEEKADAVFGSRFTPHEYRQVLFFKHELGNRFLTFLSNWVSDLNLTDMETCYKAVRTDLLKSIPIESNDFRLEPELTIKLAKRNVKMYEVPISYSGRTYQEGKKIDWRDGLKALWAIIKFGLSTDIFITDVDGGKALIALSKANRFNKWMADVIRPYVGQNVLEVGAGIGNLTRQFVPRTRYHATDINPFYLQIIEKLKSNKPYLDVSFLDICNISDFLESEQRYDTIICLNVIEHLDDDVKAMENITELLKDNGRAIVLFPRGQWLYGSMDKALEHRRRYSKQMITDLASSSGLTLERLIEFNKISAIPWYINGRILRKKTLSVFQIHIVNILTPLFRRLDKILPIPSLSYIAILKK